MAYFMCGIRVISRGKGRVVVAQAAYGAGVRLHYNDGNRDFDYSWREDVRHVELIHTCRRTRATLWNDVEDVEGRCDSVLGREILVPLPHELPWSEQLECTRRFAWHLVRRYGVAADLAIHDPASAAEDHPPNVHAHILITRRSLSPAGWGETIHALDDNPRSRAARANARGPKEVRHIRKQWERTLNAALQRIGSLERVDCRSYAARGIVRIPTIHLGRQLHAIERDGHFTYIGDFNRAAELANRLYEITGGRLNPEETIIAEPTRKRLLFERRAIMEAALDVTRELRLLTRDARGEWDWPPLRGEREALRARFAELVAHRQAVDGLLAEKAGRELAPSQQRELDLVR